MKTLGSWALFGAGLCFCLSTSLSAEPVDPPSSAADHPHWLVQLVKDANGFRVEKTTLVQSSLPKNRGGLVTRDWTFQMVDASEKVVFEGSINDPTLIRGEFRNEKDPGKIDATFIKQEGPVSFTIRLPRLSAKRLDFFEVLPSHRGQINVPKEVQTKIGSAPLVLAE